jgi:hypothetical protein
VERSPINVCILNMPVRTNYMFTLQTIHEKVKVKRDQRMKPTSVLITNHYKTEILKCKQLHQDTLTYSPLHFSQVMNLTIHASHWWLYFYHTISAFVLTSCSVLKQKQKTKNLLQNLFTMYITTKHLSTAQAISLINTIHDLSMFQL